MKIIALWIFLFVALTVAVSMNVPPVWIILAMILFAIAQAFFNSRAHKKRGEEMKALASEFGLSYDPGFQKSNDAVHDASKLVKSNILSGSINGHAIEVYDNLTFASKGVKYLSVKFAIDGNTEIMQPFFWVWSAPTSVDILRKKIQGIQNPLSGDPSGKVIPAGTSENSFASTALLLIAIVLLLGVGCFYLYQNITGGNAAPSAGTETQTSSEAQQSDYQATPAGIPAATNSAQVPATQSSDFKIYADSVSGASFKYPSSWTYQKFSCNDDGIGFCPKSSENQVGCAISCAINDTRMKIEAGTVIQSSSDVVLIDNKYKDVYEGMISSFKNPPDFGIYGIPIIKSVSPGSVAIGSPLTIDGKSFSYQRPSNEAGMGWVYQTGLRVMLQNAQGQKIDAFDLSRGNNTNGYQVEFVIPSQGCDDSRNEIACYELPIVPGNYSVSVWTALGWSNSVPLQVVSR